MKNSIRLLFLHTLLLAAVVLFTGCGLEDLFGTPREGDADLPYQLNFGQSYVDQVLPAGSADHYAMNPDNLTLTVTLSSSSTLVYDARHGTTDASGYVTSGGYTPADGAATLTLGNVPNLHYLVVWETNNGAATYNITVTNP